jgi:hypothetical protein
VQQAVARKAPRYSQRRKTPAHGHQRRGSRPTTMGHAVRAGLAVGMEELGQHHNGPSSRGSSGIRGLQSLDISGDAAPAGAQPSWGAVSSAKQGKPIHHRLSHSINGCVCQPAFALSRDGTAVGSRCGGRQALSCCHRCWACRSRQIAASVRRSGSSGSLSSLSARSDEDLLGLGRRLSTAGQGHRRRRRDRSSDGASGNFDRLPSAFSQLGDRRAGGAAVREHGGRAVGGGRLLGPLESHRRPTPLGLGGPISRSMPTLRPLAAHAQARKAAKSRGSQSSAKARSAANLAGQHLR